LHLRPYLHPETYVFCTVQNLSDISLNDVLCTFRETEGTTLILKKANADNLGLSYEYEASWISLQLETALEMVGLTAKFSQALTEQGISCNVVAAYHHDHIFVATADAEKAIQTLETIEI